MTSENACSRRLHDFTRNSLCAALAVLVAWAGNSPACAQTDVSNATQLQSAINAGDSNIVLTANIAVTTPIYIGTTPGTSGSYTINGGGFTISGTNSELFFVQAGTVAINNATLTGHATGGNGGAGANGGGGAAGLGGAIFVGATANVSVSSVQFLNNVAQGGNGGVTDNGGDGGAGGGGLNGGNGGTSLNSEHGGGGGGGNGGNGGNASSTGMEASGGGGGLQSAGGNASSGTAGNGGGPNGGVGGSTGANATGPNSGGGGSSAGSGGNGSTNGGGGGGGSNTNPIISGGAGGAYGGGGGVFNDNGGAGGFGGGGGAGYFLSGGAGGFGGGGGAGQTGAGAGGVGGGAGASGSLTSNGGGGAALGGAVFVQQGGALTVGGNVTFSGSSLTAGTGQHNGAAAGTDLFIMTNTTATLAPTSGTSLVLNGTIADDSVASLPSGQSYTPGSAAGGVLTIGSGSSTGTVVLNGANTYSGGTNITSGVLAIGNSAALGAGDVNFSGGVLTTSAGNRVILIAGNYTQGAGGTLLLNVTSPTAYDSVQLTGNGVAHLNGTLRLNFANGFAPGSGQALNLITTNNPIQGQFSSVTTNMPSIGVNLAYSDDVAATSFSQGTIVYQKSFVALLGSLLTPNQTSIAAYIDAHDQSISNSGFSNLVAALNSISGNSVALAGSFDQLSPVHFASFTSSTAFNNVSFSISQFDDYVIHHTSGGAFVGSSGGIDYSNLTVNDPDTDAGLQVIHSRLLAWSPAPAAGLQSDTPALEISGTDMKEMKPASAPQNQWNAFVSGNVVLAQDFSDPATGLGHTDATTGAGQVGFDYQIDSHFIAGAMFGYGHTDATLDTLGSSATADTYMPAVYAAYADGGWYANALGGYGFDSYTQDRNVSIGALSGTAHSAPSGDQIIGDLDGGYNFHFGRWTLGPTAGLQYVHLDVDGYTESGLPGADLTVSRNETDSLRSSLGGRLAYAINDRGIVFTPSLSASWQHEFMDQARGVTAAFDGIGAGSFAVKTADPSRDSALVDLGLDVQIDQTWTVFTDYTVQAGQSNYFGQSVQAGVKIGF